MALIGNTALRFDEEQAMLLDYARSFCADHAGSDKVRQWLETDADFTPELWQRMVEMGWTGIGISDDLGGSGLGIDAAIPVLESMGRGLLGTPLMSSLLAAQLLRRAGGSDAEPWLARIAAGVPVAVADREPAGAGGELQTAVDEQGRVTGEKRLVMDGASAEFLLVIASRGGAPVLALVDRSALDAECVTPATLIDLTHRAADIRLAQCPTLAVFEGDAVRVALRDYRLLGALLVAAESTGAAAACLDTVVGYLKTRKQFGKLIGSYQALKHPAVEILNSMDAARSLIYHAATLVGDAPLDRDAEIACRMAKAQATEALKYAGDRAVQFHGGMGFTWECDAQLYIRRAQWAQQQFGDAQHHRRVLGDLLLG